MPRADVTVTITGVVVRVRTRETILRAVIRIAAEQPAPRSQPTLYDSYMLFIKAERSRFALHPIRHPAMAQSKAASRRYGNEDRGRCSSSHTRDQPASRKPQDRRTTSTANYYLMQEDCHTIAGRNSMQ